MCVNKYTYLLDHIKAHIRHSIIHLNISIVNYDMNQNKIKPTIHIKEKSYSTITE